LIVVVVVNVNGDPFSINDETIRTGNSEVHLKVLQNGKTGERIKVVWDVGGKVEALYLADSLGKLRDVILGDGDAVSIIDHTIYKGCFLAPFANRVKNGSYAFDHTMYYMYRNEVARNNSLHGFLCSKKMHVVDTAVTTAYARLTLAYHFDGTDEGYPFEAELKLTYTLTIDHRFDLWVSVNNTMTGGGLPFTFGFHPYFAMGDVSQAVVAFDPCPGWNHVLMGPGAPQSGDLIPTGQTEPLKGFDGHTPIGGTKSNPTYYDDEYKAASSQQKCDVISTTLFDPLTNQTMVLWQDNSFRVTQIYTGSMSTVGESAVAFEPMSGLADAFNNHDHLAVISAGEQWDGQFGIFLQ